MRRADLARVVDLASQLEADAEVDPATLRRRDRTLGGELAGRASGATARVEAWLDRVRVGTGPSPGERAQRAQRALRVGLALLGLLGGTATALAVFAYEGTHPVNVVQVLAVFVGLQALLLVATGVLALPDAWRRRVPGLAALQDVLSLASPGRWQPALQRLLPPAQRHAFERALGLARRHQRLHGDVQKWALLVGSQIFAVAFNLAALATAIGLVTFSDLAFGWSTTLEIDATRLHRWVGSLALPWSSWLPEAAPALALVRDTQYFRGVPEAGGDPVASAPWWRFLVACMVTYGLLPRVLVLALALERQRAALARAFRLMPGAADLRDRLESRRVETASAEGEAEGAPPPSAGAPRAPLALPSRVRAVRWSGLSLPSDAAERWVAETLGAPEVHVSDGGAGSGRSDAELVAELAGAEGAPVFLVKAWEPPLGEFADLLAELRAARGDRDPIWVLPFAEDESGRLVLADGAAGRVWRRRLDATGDPALAVHTREPEA